MTTEVNAAVKSVLDKPLHQLTEDDISQLTREDCRRYLKEKGMRRPSWNKSQAIQQVISLKSLLEPSPSPSNAAVLKSAVVRPPLNSTNTVNSNSSSFTKELSPPDADGSVSAMGEDGGQNQQAGTSSSEPTREGECRPTATDSKAIAVRDTDALHLPIDQMTIFYSGGINVYDGVPLDKARAIMHLAASPTQFSQDEPNTVNSTPWSSPCQLPTSSVKFNASTQDGAAAQSVLQGKMAEPIQQCRSDGSIFYEQDVDGQTNRQVSLQRYFEKRKDRGKFKMKRKIGSSPSGLEMYLNHQTRTPVINGQTTRNNTSPRSQLGIPCSSYGLVNKDQKNHGLSVDLNDKGHLLLWSLLGCLILSISPHNGQLKFGYGNLT
ncbi:protein TIFY 4B isoform X3 [Beta vulgaris subsp. vulgaris]|uniref:protein TIFY 4B isoform X3 n=1 Tax=Beta vulgaris subsp. vulgaris TaxID=3555 RepID=UPI00203763ED|nr:protein TIFY 4B isoform X3 [Beta vulgaris subsp. vulgaris]